ncbi:hypothetical protein AVEN_241209-1 [Araneus ventricosus]|uniref:Uncharacterized protein n=1 Tax=Araneus ventricosus TaxID=182803 RepID=A0A4Y2CZP1_ARAVE|nr:hypothetical protein AVEN_241209-1 [Araneus ventricosus]
MRISILDSSSSVKISTAFMRLSDNDSESKEDNCQKKVANKLEPGYLQRERHFGRGDSSSPVGQTVPHSRRADSHATPVRQVCLEQEVMPISEAADKNWSVSENRW